MRRLTLPVIFAVILILSCKRIKHPQHQVTHKVIALQKPIHQQMHDTVLLVSMAFGETNLQSILGDRIASFYHLQVKYINAPLPDFSYYRERNRYRADSLLKYLSAFNNASTYKFVCGLTSKDISATNGNIADWGVCGLGALDGSACVISSFRLKWHQVTHSLTERLQKVILHELGHNYGLQHCTSSYPCLMKAAKGKVSEIDGEPMDMCKVCRSKH